MGHSTSQGFGEGVMTRQEMWGRSRDHPNHGGVNRASPRSASGPDIQPTMLSPIGNHGDRMVTVKLRSYAFFCLKQERKGALLAIMHTSFTFMFNYGVHSSIVTQLINNIHAETHKENHFTLCFEECSKYEESQ
jgi:hypothetical protein